jgi:hypothetical protein
VSAPEIEARKNETAGNVSAAGRWFENRQAKFI